MNASYLRLIAILLVFLGCFICLVAMPNTVSAGYDPLCFDFASCGVPLPNGSCPAGVCWEGTFWNCYCWGPYLGIMCPCS